MHSTANYGFLAKFQHELGAAVCLPVCTSSLMLVPMVHCLLPPGNAVGILTAETVRCLLHLLRRP